MIDITKKIKTHRSAIAQAIVKVSRQETMNAVINKTVPKGDVIEASRIAGLFGIKKTSDLIPDCHPLPVEFASISYRMEALEIIIEVEVHTIYRTGVEVEAMHGASVVALTIYDMLKPIDKKLEIHSIKLLSKNGGKSQFVDIFDRPIKATVIVCSDSIAFGSKNDSSGKAIISKLEQTGVLVEDYCVIPDDCETIQNKIIHYYDARIDLILLTGGTGLSPRDVTPEAIRPMFDREIVGIGETIRNYGQELMPYAMLSRCVAGLKGNTLIIALPGSTRGAKESMDALFPYVLHVFKAIGGARHD